MSSQKKFENWWGGGGGGVAINNHGSGVMKCDGRISKYIVQF